MKNWILLLAVPLALSSCGKIKELDDRTKNMAKNTDELKQGIQEVRKELDIVKLLTRIKEAEETRNRSFNQIKHSESLSKKIEAAGVYYKAFEFQLWTGFGGDSHHYRERLFEAALTEYFLSIPEYLDKIEKKDWDEVSPMNQDEHVENLTALAVSMHVIQDYQQDFVVGHYTDEKISVLSLIEKGLHKLSLLNQGKLSLQDVRPFEKVVMENEDKARVLLQLRYRAMALLTVADVSEIKDMNKVEVAWKMLMRKWDSKFNRLNRAKQAKVLRYVNEALRVREFLHANGYRADFGKVKVAGIYKSRMLKKILKKMQVPGVKSCDNCLMTIEAHNTNEFKRLIDKLI